MGELISIIMPAYNAEKYLEETILSVINQTYTNWELIIVNDGSVDGTQQLAEAYQSRDSRIRVIAQANTGQGGARNAALKVAKGTWLAFLDADDLWVKTKLEQQIKLSESLPEVDLFFSAGWKFEERITNAEPYEIVKGKFDAAEMYRLEYLNNYIPILSVIVKKTMADAVGLMDESRHIQNCEDWDYWVRLALKGARFYGMKERLFYYRRHGNNNSADTIKLRLAQTAVLVKNYSPELLNETQTHEAFIPLINSLMIALVIAGRKADAQKLVADVGGVLPGYVKRYNLLLNLTGSHTIKVFDLANRLYIKLKK